MQSSWGDQSPVIKAGGNVSVTYGLDEERVKAMLMEQQEQLFRKMRDSGFAADDRERRLLEQQLQEVSAKLADIERSYNEELARRKAADDVLAQLRGQLPEAQIEQAQASLRQGDTAAARQVFHAVADKAGAAVALAAFQLGQMAEGDLEYTEALRQYKKAAALEKDNPKYLLAAGKMAMTMGEYSQAQEWLEHLLKIMEAEGDDVKIASAMNTLANLYVEQGKYDKADQLYEQAIFIYESCFGKNSMATICFLENIATLRYLQERYSESEEIYNKVIRILLKEKCSNLMIVATILDGLSSVYQKQKRLKFSKQLCDIALAIRKNKFGENHIELAGTMINLGIICFRQRLYTDAEMFCMNAILIYKNFLKDSHPIIAEAMNDLAGIYCIQGKYSEAECLILQSIDIFNKLFPAGHPRIELFQKNYNELKRKRAKDEQAAGHAKTEIFAYQKEYDEMNEKMAEL